MGCGASKPHKESNNPTSSSTKKPVESNIAPKDEPNQVSTSNIQSTTLGGNNSSKDQPLQPSRKDSLSKMIIQSSINLAAKMNAGLFTALTSMEDIRRKYRFEPKIYGNLIIGLR